MDTRTEYEKTYYEACNIYDPKMSYEEYVVHIYRCLLLSDWHYDPDTAMRLIHRNAHFIKEAFAEKQSVIDAMVEVGYCAG